jgi:hypothetical protein
MPFLYQFVSCSRSHVLTARISFSPLPEDLTLWIQRLHNFHTQHTSVCECSLKFLSPPLRIQLQLVVGNVIQTHTPFLQTIRAALSVGYPCTYTDMRNKHQCCYFWIFTLISLLLNEKKMWGITFWATFINRLTFTFQNYINYFTFPTLLPKLPSVLLASSSKVLSKSHSLLFPLPLAFLSFCSFQFQNFSEQFSECIPVFILQGWPWLYSHLILQFSTAI